MLGVKIRDNFFFQVSHVKQSKTDRRVDFQNWKDEDEQDDEKEAFEEVSDTHFC